MAGLQAAVSAEIAVNDGQLSFLAQLHAASVPTVAQETVATQCRRAGAIVAYCASGRFGRYLWEPRPGRRGSYGTGANPRPAGTVAGTTWAAVSRTSNAYRLPQPVETAVSSWSDVSLPDEVCGGAETVLRYLVFGLADKGIVRRTWESVTQHLLKRERLGSTALGNGVAVPRAASPGVEQVTGLIARSSCGVPWEGPGRQRVKVIGLVLAPIERVRDFGRTLEAMHRLLESYAA